MTYHLVFLAGGLVIVACTLISLRRAHIRPEYSVSWLLVGAVLSVFSLFPEPIARFSRSLGLEPQSYLLFIGGALVTALVFEISRVVSDLRDENVLLAQRVAILELRLKQRGSRDGVEST